MNGWYAAQVALRDMFNIHARILDA